MGQKVSRVYGFFVKRPIQRYNVEERAHKVISKIEDPSGPAMRAPMFQSDKEILERVRQENPNFGQEMSSKDSALHTRLRDVYVESHDPPDLVDYQENKQRHQNPEKPLPVNRTSSFAELHPGVGRATKVTTTKRGKITLESALDMLTEHGKNPDVNDAERLANTYRLNPDTLSHVLKHYQLFKIHIPEVKETPDFDPLKAGQTWVEDTKDELKGAISLMEERKAHRKRLAQKDDERKKLQKLGPGASKQ
eukprot:TRINITY_DN14632_c0_g1_i4.p1 TRINITY_DN14632_c0_g1~~TRINITY_DN14632_c0_g1_i4.p1  ORF type:complete len:250 (+),score=54.99 TRINITY_DN14632_c0_g1_i4:106-855(+)